jgi:TRAP-type C4-dicarboxylate transport system permease small subunit
MTEADNTPAHESAKPPPRSTVQTVAQFALVKIPFAICGVLLLTAIAINIANVVGRYVFGISVAWAEEVMSYIIIWGVFISVGSITYQGLHLRMDLLVLSVRGKLAMALGGLTVVLILVCSLFIMRQSFHVLAFYISNGETSMGARIPLVYPHAALVVGFFLASLAAIVRFRSYLTGKFD